MPSVPRQKPPINARAPGGAQWNPSAERRQRERRSSERPLGLELRLALALVFGLQVLAWALVLVRGRSEIGAGDLIFLTALALAFTSLLFLALITLDAARRWRRVRQEAERRLETAIERVPALVWTTDRDLHVTSFMGALGGGRGLQGNKAERDTGNDFLGSISSRRGDTSPILEGYEAALRGENAVCSGSVDGTSYEAYICPLYGAGGTIDGTISLALNVSERLSAEAEIRDRERTLETLLQNLPDAVVRVGRDGRHIFANPACESVLGMPSTEIIGKTIQELPLPPRLRESWMGRVKKVLASGKTLDVEDTLESPAGLRYHETRLVPERDELGNVVTVLIVIHDVSERHGVERSLSDSEERFRVTFEEAPIAMLLIGDDARIRAGNAAACALLGYSPEELAGKTIYEITHPDDVELTRDVAVRLFEKNEPTAVAEKRYLRKNGEVVWARISVSAVRDSEQRFVHNVVQIIDITSLKQAERALRESNELQRLVTEHASDLIAVVGLDFTIHLISQSARDGLGYEPEELIGHNIKELIDPEMIEDVRAAAREILAGKPPWNRAFRLRHRNGDWRMFEGTGSVASDENGEPAYIVVVLRDVTERTQLERQLLIAQKMEAVGQLAGGVAHDFNNLLTVINGFADMAIKALGNREEGIRHYLAEIGHAGQRAAELTQRLLAFSRQQVLQPQIVDINSIIEEYVGMLRRILGEEIELLTRLEPKLRTVEVDPGQLGQVLMNLAVNARDAIPQGGTVTIATQNIELKKAIPVAQGTLARGSYVLLSVADDGEGMPPETREHAFEPFFTTKEPGQGTGLGLATVLGIVEQSGGEIAVDSEPGAGTTFRVYLLRSKAAVAKKKSRVEKVQAGTGTILVVEDDAAVRKLVAKILLEAGYRVLIAALPSEAISRANWEPSIDVLVTDVVMPEMNGHELAQRLLTLRPDLRVLYISGYTPDVVRAKGVLTHQESFLQKPFTAAVLTQAVRDLAAGTATKRPSPSES